MNEKRYTYKQWKAIHRRKVIHAVKAYLLGFAVASFPFFVDCSLYFSWILTGRC
jgi:hypothetical protein